MPRDREVVKAYHVGTPACLVVVIPRKLRDRINAKAGDYFRAKISGSGELVYTPLKFGGESSGRN